MLTRYFRIILLLSLIAIDEASNSVVLKASEQSYSKVVAYSSLFVFMILQFIAAPIQSAISDFWCRRKSLYIAMGSTVISSFLLSFFPYLVLIVKGLIGNVVPIARAGVADENLRDFRSSIGLTTVAISLGYLIIRELSDLFGSRYLYLGVASLGLITLFFLYFYKDERDIEYRSPRVLQNASLTIKIKASLVELYRDFLSKPFFFNSLLAYFFFEMAFYCLFLTNIELGIESFKHIPYLMVLGYFLGVILLWSYTFTMKTKNGEGDKIYIVIGIVISLFALILFIFYKKLALVATIFAFGFGFFVPALFSRISYRRRTIEGIIASHEQGKIYGLIDSADSLAFILSILIINIFEISKLHFYFFISFTFYLLGVYNYIKSEYFNIIKTNGNIKRIK